MHTKYKHEEIMCSNKQKTYDKHASEAGFLLGGIGTLMNRARIIFCHIRSLRSGRSAAGK